VSTLDISSLGRFELASRIALDEPTGSWFVVGVGDEHRLSLLGEDIENLVDHPVAVVHVTDRDSLVNASHEHAGGVALFFTPGGLEELCLDDARSRLQRQHAAVLAIPEPEISRLVTIAPHFVGWAGNRVFLVEEDRFLDSEAQEERLEALREHYGMSDEEFLAKVEHGRLSLEPDHAEWLVLLGRSELLKGSR
jgi:hypothetical protein